MNKLKSEHEYWIGRNLAVALVNSDTSGLNDDDLEALNEVEGHIIILNDEVSFRKCCLTGLWSDCVLINEQIFNQGE